MSDIVMLGLCLGFFALTGLITKLCDQLGKE